MADTYYIASYCYAYVYAMHPIATSYGLSFKRNSYSYGMVIFLTQITPRYTDLNTYVDTYV